MAAYYARVSAEDLEELKSNPDQFWDVGEMSWNLDAPVETAASECLYVDKDWLVLSWLCSPLGRAEERHQTALIKVMQRRESGENLDDNSAFKAAIKQECEALGFPYVDFDAQPKDLVLTAIQGRRQGDDGPIIADLGAVASAFDPQEAKTLADALAGLSESELHRQFDVNEMKVLDLPTDGDESELDEFILPQLARVQALYDRAVRAGQHVVVVIS